MTDIVVLVSGGGTNLQALIDGIENKTVTNARIVAVISSKADVYALERAKTHNIPSHVVERKTYTDLGKYETDLLELFKSYNPGLIVHAGFLSILGDEICKKYANRMINIHPALIPSFCGKGFYGLKVHQAVLDKGIKLTGATVHFVNEIPDGGAVIMQKAVEVMDNDTPETLQQRVMTEAEQILLPAAVNYYCNGKIITEGNKARIIS